MKDKERKGELKRFKDDNFEIILDEDMCLTIKELAIQLNVTQQYILQLLHQIGMVQKQDTWLQQELIGRDMESMNASR